MTDVRERVARAILETDPTCDYDGCKKRVESGILGPSDRAWWEDTLHAQADNALLACGYAEMRKALKDAATAYEDLHDFANDSVCKWSDETQKHCPGVCDYIGCLATHIKNARSILERTGEK